MQHCFIIIVVSFSFHMSSLKYTESKIECYAVYYLLYFLYLYVSLLFTSMVTDGKEVSILLQYYNNKPFTGFSLINYFHWSTVGEVFIYFSFHVLLCDCSFYQYGPIITNSSIHWCILRWVVSNTGSKSLL